MKEKSEYAVLDKPLLLKIDKIYICKFIRFY